MWLMNFTDYERGVRLSIHYLSKDVGTVLVKLLLHKTYGSKFLDYPSRVSPEQSLSALPSCKAKYQGAECHVPLS